MTGTLFSEAFDRPRFAVDLRGVSAFTAAAPLPLPHITKARSGATPHAGGVASDISLGRAAEILRISREDMRQRAADWSA